MLFLFALVYALYVHDEVNYFIIVALPVEGIFQVLHHFLGAGVDVGIFPHQGMAQALGHIVRLYAIL